jgi:hypothetical protein
MILSRNSFTFPTFSRYKKSPLQTLRKNLEETNLEKEDGRELALLFLANDQGTPCPERHENDGRREAVHHLTGKRPTQT